jgi:ATP-dependent DNA helicase RecQ
MLRAMIAVASTLESLHRTFGHPAFRPGQEAVVQAVLDGRDVLAVMPTGAGKSLGYQLPAVLLPGLTLVVSPLIALMKDQVDDLTRRGVPAAALHSMMSPGERRDALDAARNGRIKLLYVSPERFASEVFLRVLPELVVSRFAVDEAHCVSEWGHEFRPDYRALAGAAQRCRRSDGLPGRPPMAALTATATPEVREDIVSLLGLDTPEVFVAGFDRPNLTLAVRRVSGDRDKAALLPGLVGERRALVYASTRRSAETAAGILAECGVAAEAYHAGLPEEQRTRVQDAFAAGTVRVVCATNAFGMGIDRPDIEAVVHFEVPGSLEAYYQEIGRAGRDGRPADVTLLWSYADVHTREFLIEKEAEADDPRRARAAPDPEERERKRALDRKKLRRMVAYADSAACLRGTLLRYFGERGAPESCGNCGPCGSRRGLDAEQLLLLRKILSGVARAGQRFGARKIAAMLVGETDGLPESLLSLSTTGLLKGHRAASIAHWLDAARGGGLLMATDDEYRVLSLTARGREVMAGRVDEVELTVPRVVEPPSRTRKKRGSERTAAAVAIDLGEADPALLARLKSWRRAKANHQAVPAYVVCPDRTLLAVAAARPRSMDALSQVSGVGPARLAAYGRELLDLVAGVSA